MNRITQIPPSGNTPAAPSGTTPAAPSGTTPAPSGNNKKRQLEVDEEGFTLVTSRKKQQKPNTEIPSNNSTTNKTTFNKFKIISANNQDGYRQLADFESHHPNSHLHAKPNLRGEWIITPRDLASYNMIKNSKYINTIELINTEKHFKAVITSYPLALPLEPLTKQHNVATAERMKNKYGNLTTAILTTFIGHIPDKVNLGIWGTFRVTRYNPEPLRCFKCQRYGHHKNQCTLDFKCAVCSGRHDTQVCLNKHKDGAETHARCPNCGGKHHAWYNRCPTRLSKIHQNIPENTTKPRKTLLPTPNLPTSNPWHRNTTPANTANSPPNFYTPINTPNLSDFPALPTQQPKEQRPKPQPRRQQTQTKQLQTTKQKQKQPAKHQVTKQQQQETVQTHTQSSTPNTTTGETLTLTKTDLREIMENFVKTLLSATQTQVPEPKIQASLDTLVNSAERRSNTNTHSSISRIEMSFDNLIKTTIQNTDTSPELPPNPIPVMPPLSPIQTPPAPQNNNRDPRIRKHYNTK